MILVTGASGLLGSNLVLTGARAGRAMVALTHQHPIRLEGVSNVQLDLRDAATVRSTVREVRPAAVIHCAALTNIDEAERNPEEAVRLNVDASETLAAASADVGAKFVYISTDTVFDGTRPFSTETDSVNPLNVYGRTKLEGERVSAEKNPDSIIARTNLYGWNSRPKHSLAEWVLDTLERGETVHGFTDVYFCPMLVNDLVDVLFAMVDRGLRGVYHVVGGERVSKHEFALRLARRFQLDASLVVPGSVHDAALPAPRAHDISLSTGRAAAALGRPMPNVEQGLERFAQLATSGFRADLRAMAGSA